MGEIFIKKTVLVLLFFLGLFFFVSVLRNIAADYEYNFLDKIEILSDKNDEVTGFAVHPNYPSFSAQEPGFAYDEGGHSISVSDYVIYRMGYYSVNGSAWRAFNLSGNLYGLNSNWIRGSASYVLPVFGVGEYYAIVYSCSYDTDEWDCHGDNWQLVEINNSFGDDVPESYARVYLDKGLRYGDALDYQCGNRDIDGAIFSYGECPISGYDCVDNLCIARDDLSCDGVSCEYGEYCSHGVCLLDVSGETYFVALWGNDSWNGTFEQPFYSWQRVVGELGPGDIAYFRGGVWMISDPELARMSIDGPRSYNTAVSGTAENPIRYFNYPGEKPIMDQELVLPDTYTGWGGGIGMGDVEYIHLRGLTVRHVHQSPPNYTRTWKPHSEVGGIGCSPCANIIYENLVVHDIDGRGFQHWSGAWSLQDAEYSVEAGYSDEIQEPLFESDNTSWINCDAYNLFDRYSEEPGNAADGWKVETYYGSTFTWKNCRAFNYSDDGFDPHGSGKRVFDGCWAMATDKYGGLTDLWGMERNGFKTTGATGITLEDDEHQVIFKNCIAAYDRGSGFITNLGGDGSYSSQPLLYNNLAYYDGHAYWELYDGTVINNIAYGTRNIGPTGEIYNIVGDAYSEDGFYTESNNTWLLNKELGWPPSYINPDYNVTDDDFVSLDMSQLMRPRKADFSLPDITFGHLAPGSDLIDGGVVIPGYHCSTEGAHPGENCREWYGSAPDLGPFESNY